MLSAAYHVHSTHSLRFIIRYNIYQCIHKHAVNLSPKRPGHVKVLIWFIATRVKTKIIRHFTSLLCGLFGIN